ncbi:hypothetical protein [Paenibacillus eucommiae]|uniref:ABC-2 family transporter protein n=1 Tax=Paenibacillus eucommiae TaxID=1355755 RepID=A0ABS4J3R0_9BACL|nr:hypothetical protein [Paenibacillus eucommiae]MBP1994478.1 hypothetical protein [Paenibacillus eucommiae]
MMDKLNPNQKNNRNHQEDLKLDPQDDLTNDAVDEIVRHLQLMPEPPLPGGFVEEAMAGWRRSREKRVLPSLVSPTPLNLQQMARILFLQGLWRDVVWGVLLFALGFLVLNVGKVLPPMLILPVVGCIPLLVVVSNTARHALCGMGELTRSLRIPLQWYVQARFLLVGVVSLVLNEIVTVAFFPLWGEEVLSRVALLWCIPTLVNAAIALILSARIRSVGQLASVLVLLPVFWLILLSGEPIAVWTASVELFWLWGLAIAAAVLLGGAMLMNGKYLKKGGFLLGA